MGLKTQLMMAAQIAGMVVLYTFARVLMTRAAKTDETTLLTIAYAVLMVGNILYFQVLKISGLAIATTLSSVAQTVFALMIGWLLLGEQLTLQKLLGAAIAVIGVTIVMLPPLVRR